MKGAGVRRLTAPSQLGDMHFSGRNGMQSWRCTICQYVYDPAAGDPDNGIEPNTSFESLPDDWACPICGAGKELFEPA